MNLLPPKEKTENQKDYLYRFSVGLVGALLASLLIGGFAMLAPHILIQAKQAELKTDLASLKNAQSASGSDDTYSLLEMANQQVDFLSLQSGPSLTKAAKEILARRPTGVTIVSLAYRLREDSSERSVAVSLRGVASRREAIIEFVKNLQAEPTFTGINVPVSSFAKDRDIEFSLTFIQNEK